MLLKQPAIYDFSSWEDRIDWDKIASGKTLAVIMRASYQILGGRTRAEDITAVAYVAECKKRGIKTGLYHFLTPNGIAEQAALFISVWNKCGGTDLPPIVDVEVDLQQYYRTAPNIIGNAVWQSHIKTFIDIVASATGRTPMIYTSQKYWIFACTKNLIGSFIPPIWTKDYRLWVAQYPDSPDTWDRPTAMPLGWSEYSLWQYAENGRQNGFIANDLNVASQEFAESLGEIIVDPPPPDPTEVYPDSFIMTAKINGVLQPPVEYFK